ncbi:zinc mynd-type domain containing protein [Rutstroemia sp. NJR-2017a BVV2]|nr:zinc mynd-type domain containing protein [Rutstroemia sp. NJR-2017a BVV2]
MSSTFPNLHDSTAFLTFSTTPLADPSVPTNDASPAGAKTYLAATISQNMTLSTTPTFICTDAASASFALTVILAAPLTPAQLEGSAASADAGGFDIKKMRKGHTVLVPRPERHGVREGKQGYVRCRWEDLVIVPTSLEKLVGMSERYLKEREDLGPEAAKEHIMRCQACDKSRNQEELSRCRGCEAVWYCDKPCQTKGWSERGHKGECKVLKAMGAVAV